MNTRGAAYLTGHHYPGGVPSLAARMGMDARELSRKLNPRVTAKLRRRLLRSHEDGQMMSGSSLEVLRKGNANLDQTLVAGAS